MTHWKESQLIIKHNKRFPYWPPNFDKKWTPGSISFKQYLILLFMMSPTAIISLLPLFNRPHASSSRETPLLESLQVDGPDLNVIRQASVAMLEGISKLSLVKTIIQPITGGLVSFYNRAVDKYIPPSHFKVNAKIASDIGLSQEEKAKIQGKGRSEWLDVYLSQLDNQGIELNDLTKLTATSLFAFGLVIEQGGKLVK